MSARRHSLWDMPTTGHLRRGMPVCKTDSHTLIPVTICSTELTNRPWRLCYQHRSRRSRQETRAVAADRSGARYSRRRALHEHTVGCSERFVPFTCQRSTAAFHRASERIVTHNRRRASAIHPTVHVVEPRSSPTIRDFVGVPFLIRPRSV